MLKAVLNTVALTAATCCIAAMAFLWMNGIRSIDDLRNVRAMRSVDAPVVVALASGSLTEGSTTRQLVRIQEPDWTKRYGRFVTYGFTPQQSYDYQTVSAVDGRIAAAHVGSCTWRWTFFDNVPDDISATVGTVDGLRNAIEGMPEHAAIIQPLLDTELAKLAVDQTSSSAKAE